MSPYCEDKSDPRYLPPHMRSPSFYDSGSLSFYVSGSTSSYNFPNDNGFTSRPDWYCEYCDSVNRAERESCPHCGAPPSKRSKSWL
jgi:hypothetical protein